MHFFGKTSKHFMRIHLPKSLFIAYHGNQQQRTLCMQGIIQYPPRFPSKLSLSEISYVSPRATTFKILKRWRNKKLEVTQSIIIIPPGKIQSGFFNRIHNTEISMKTLYLLVLFFLRCFCAFNPLPYENWEAGTIDFGNGGDNTFYLLIKSRINSTTPPPLMMWLVGGQGLASLTAVYFDSGPYFFSTSYKVERNPYAWTKYVDILYLDNPVGTCYSETKSNATLCRNETCVARNLYTFLRKFIYDKHPEYQKRPFYLIGHSYAGHYVPAFAEYLVKANNPDVNFVGLGLGNAIIDNYAQLPTIPDFLFQNHNVSTGMFFMLKLGMILCEVASKFKIDWFDIPCTQTFYLVADIAGIKNPEDITIDSPPDEEILAKFSEYMNKKEVKQAFGVENKEFKMFNGQVAAAMRKDWATPFTASLEYCLKNGKRIMMWYGDKDLICNYLGGLDEATKLEWEGKEGFKAAETKGWNDEMGKEIGRIKKYDKLKFIQVYDGSHDIFDRQRASGLHVLLELLKSDQISQYHYYQYISARDINRQDGRFLYYLNIYEFAVQGFMH
eukprot:TRINITY_DN11680_c0_g1_i1.p1 TRINITY_DN11680_c0_g1~~TRINITY_DN11680_c0_g1_i1.p1  ORF type:complete len:556 (-),score=21.04 TRINITY_DN11680_c0_g1_i1:43-1710(-)